MAAPNRDKVRRRIMGTPEVLRVISQWRFGRGAGRALVLAAGGLACWVLASGCDWLTTATPEPPSAGRVARTVTLTEPDSVLANIKEAFRVGSVQAYMRGIVQPGGGSTEDFTAYFDPYDKQQVPASDAAGTALVNGGWHSVEERNALTSVMNALASAPVSPSDTGRAVVVMTADLGVLPEGRVITILYRLNVASGSSPYVEGTARLTLKQNNAAEWQILTWQDYRNPPPSKDSWGALRFKNRS